MRGRIVLLPVELEVTIETGFDSEFVKQTDYSELVRHYRLAGKPVFQCSGAPPNGVGSLGNAFRLELTEQLELVLTEGRLLIVCGR